MTWILIPAWVEHYFQAAERIVSMAQSMDLPDGEPLRAIKIVML